MKCLFQLISNIAISAITEWECINDFNVAVSRSSTAVVL